MPLHGPTEREAKNRRYDAEPNPTSESYALLSLPTLAKDYLPPIPKPVQRGFFPVKEDSPSPRPRPTGRRRRVKSFLLPSNFFVLNVYMWTRRLDPKVFIPGLVIALQIVILLFGWIFFLVTVSKPRPLPTNLAVWARDHSQGVTMIVTIASTVLSATSGFLYARAIRWSLARLLAGPVSLYTMTSSIRIASQSPVFNIVHMEWSIGALVCALAVSGQTAGWTTLLTPKIMDLDAPMSGFELDVLSPDFQQLMVANQNVVTPDLFTNVIPLVDTSGATSVGTYFGLPSILNFNQLSYLNSTNGILPANFQQWFSTAMSSSGSAMPINTRLELTHSSPPGFPTSYSMTQQGFTSNVSCVQRHLDTTTSPSLRLLSSSSTVFESTVVTIAQKEVQCPGLPGPLFSQPVITSPNVDAVFAVACPVNQTDGTQKWDLIITGIGIYSFMNSSICTVSPQVTTVSIDYNDATNLFNSSFPSFVNGSESWNITNAPWVGEYSTSIFLRGLVVAQSTTGNNFGNTVSSFLTSIPAYPDLFNDILEQYIRGVMEFSVTLLRTAYTQENNRLFSGNSSAIPSSMKIATSGRYRTQTIGWYQAHDTAPLVLLAPTFVCLVSIAIILVTQMQRRGFNEPKSNHYFDPGNIVHVIGASSAGGIREPFPPFNEDPTDYSQEVRIKLGPVDGDPDRVGLVQVFGK